MKLSPELEAKVLALAVPQASGGRKPSVAPPAQPELRAVVTVPGVPVVAEANRRDHWAVRRRRGLVQKAAALKALVALGPAVRDRFRAAEVVTVRFVRIGGKRLDSDNLVGGFKAIRDQLAKWLLVDDGSDRLRWEWPAQEAGEKGFRIELTAGGSAQAKGI